MKFVIFHGSFGHPKENWIPNLEKALKSLEQEVIVPKFPTDNYRKIDQKGSPGKVEETKQNLTNWLQIFKMGGIHGIFSAVYWVCMERVLHTFYILRRLT
jgi:hypothetical protein